MLKKLLLLVFIGIVLPVQAKDKVILVYGDSLSAGFGIPIQKGWVSLLQQRLNYQGYSYQVVNASISGDTSSGARARLDNILKQAQPVITIVELGGNDGLRGIPPDEMEKNLAHIITHLLDNGSDVLLVPMMIPPNFGQVYTDKFMGVYKTLADNHDVVYSRFILDGIALTPDLMQDDGIHPTAAGQPLMLDNIWPDLKNMLDEIENSK